MTADAKGTSAEPRRRAPRTGKAFRWILLLAFVAVVALAVRLIGPAVPREIRLLTGPEGTTFFEDGLRYRDFCAQHGVAVRLETTAGSAESLRGVVDADGPTAALVWGLWDPSGANIAAPEGVESLGAVDLQPLWIFVRKDLAEAGITGLRGLRVEAGRKGSDARLLALLVLGEEGVGDGIDFGREHPSTREQVEQTIESGKLAALIVVGEPRSTWVDLLLRSPQFQVISVRRAEAFAVRFPFLEVVRYPEGAQDLRANLPDRDLRLLAARAQLLVSEQFPPALANLLLQAASEIHGGPTPFSARGTFPSPNSAPLPLNRAADNYYRNGPPRLQAYLPFRLATWVDRFSAAFVTVASAAVTLFQLIPALVSLPFRRRLR
ncbi:MAG: hypothetical protein H6511_09770, partial [Holophagales bacterium]|nr:hypothetical protein [Holophagales bacterium]